jgi:PTS system glucose-specific IIC component
LRLVNEAGLTENGVGAVVRFDGGKIHLLAGLNADQYAAEISAQVSAM